MKIKILTPGHELIVDESTKSTKKNSPFTATSTSLIVDPATTA